MSCYTPIKVLTFCVSKNPVHNAHLFAIQEIVQFLGAFANTDHCEALTLSAQRQEFLTNLH
jgi:nicotinic acid mononucleotide adenylyltransferase